MTVPWRWVSWEASFRIHKGLRCLYSPTIGCQIKNRNLLEGEGQLRGTAANDEKLFLPEGNLMAIPSFNVRRCRRQLGPSLRGPIKDVNLQVVVKAICTADNKNPFKFSVNRQCIAVGCLRQILVILVVTVLNL